MIIAIFTTIADVIIQPNYSASLQLIKTHFHAEAMAKVYKHVVLQDVHVANESSTADQQPLTPLFIKILSIICTVFRHDTAIELQSEIVAAIDPSDVLEGYSKWAIRMSMTDNNKTISCLPDRFLVLQYYANVVVQYFEAINKLVRKYVRCIFNALNYLCMLRMTLS